MIDWGRFWILQGLFWSAGAVFSNSSEKREKFAARIIVVGICAFILSLLFQFVFWNGTVQVEYIARAISMFLMVFFVYFFPLSKHLQDEQSHNTYQINSTVPTEPNQ